MSSTIDIDVIKDANSHNSAMALTRSWAKCFKKYALNKTEELTDDPANSFNIFTHLTAQGASKMMYEQAARINETNESTAILPKSLLNKLSADELKGIFGNPSSTTIAFCVKKSDIIEQSVLIDSATGLRRLVINKDMTVAYESHPNFTLPYDVIINVKPVTSSTTDSTTGVVTTTTTNNIYAYYDMVDSSKDGMRSIYNIYNQYISSREMRFENEVYIAFFLKVFQIFRKEISFYVSDPDTSDNTIVFENSLVGVEVFRKPSGVNATETLMIGTTEGTINTSKDYYNYSYDYKRNKQNYNVIFNKSTNAKLSVGDTIRIIIYTTNGTLGNIDFPYMAYNLTSMKVNYNQTLSIASQNAMTNIVTLVFARDKASTGGTDQLSIDEIRNKIIQKKYSRSILISDNEIINKAKLYGFDCYKTRHDVINMYYRATGKIIYNSMTLSTGTSTLYFDLAKKEKLLSGYNYYMIEPGDVFKYNKNEQKFYYTPRFSSDASTDTVETFEEYAKKYNEADDPESIMEVCFPFYMRYDNTSNPKISVYDMDVKTTEYLSFTKYNEDYALDKIDIPYIRIQRNPFRGVTDGTYNEDIANTYYITFLVYTGENTLNKIYAQYKQDNSPINSDDLTLYNSQYLVFNLELEGTLSNEKYLVDPRLMKITNIDTMVTDGYIAYQAAITTNNFISDDKQIQMKGIKRSSSLGNDYSILYPMDTNIKFNLSGRFTDVGTTNTYNCITYESEEVQLVRYLTDYFGINFDIQTNENQYETYGSNVPKTYSEPVFMLNKNYDSTITDTDDPNHYEYIVKKNSDGKVDFLPGLDSNNNTISIPNYEVNHKAGDSIIDYTEITDTERANGPITGREYYILTDVLNNVYTKVDSITAFDVNTKYYRAYVELLHKAGDYKIYNKNTGLLIEDATDLSSPINEYHLIPNTYTGILKNVSWINRLYFSNTTMYESIRDVYNDLIDNVVEIKKSMFDGGLIYVGLKRTSGNSSKYSAFKLSDNTTEYIKNIALKFVFRVKFKSAESVDYKKQQIIDATSSYVNSLADNDLSIDGLFEIIKSAVPDIQYINLTQLNNYYNGDVQTILNNIDVKTELLTVSQKITKDSDGNITFVPDITVNVVNSD